MSNRQVILVLSIIFLLYFSGLHFDLRVLIIRPADLLLLGLTGLVFVSVFSSGTFLTAKLKLGRASLALGLFVLYRFFNGLIQADFAIAIKELIQSLLIVGFALLLANFCNTPDRRREIFALIRRLLVATSLVMFVYFVQSGQAFGFKTFGPFKHIYALAALFVIDRFLAKPSRSNLLLLVTTITIMLFSGEKKGWIALSFATCYLLWQLYQGAAIQKRRYVRLSVLVFVFAGVISIPLILPSTPYLTRQFNSLSEVAQMAGSRLLQDPRVSNQENHVRFSSRSNISRFYVLSTALDQVQKTPVFGIGPQNLKPLVLESSPFDWLDPGAHNDYLNTLVEYGAMGLLLQVLVIILLFRYASYLQRMATDSETRQQINFIKSLLIFGVAINGFFGGSDALNLLYVLVPMGLLFSIQTPDADVDLAKR